MTDLFEAMGCEIEVRGATGVELLEIQRLFRDREQVFSRFLPQSELNRVNASAGEPTLVSPLFAETLRVALHAAKETGGLVTPTLGAALEAAGYTRDFASLTPEPTPAGAPCLPGPIATLGRIVSLGRDVRLDLNGVVKSIAVDDALALISGDGSVSAGGDLASHGEISVELPLGDVVALRRGALATSGTTKRRWLRGGQIQHHLIDPRTGAPVESPWEQVTAVGATCVAADIAAKAGVLLGCAGPAWLDGRSIPARFLTPEGDIVLNETWKSQMHEAASCT
jgi:thiamine biosynthesis lipoprotein